MKVRVFPLRFGSYANTLGQGVDEINRERRADQEEAEALSSSFLRRAHCELKLIPSLGVVAPLQCWFATEAQRGAAI